MSLKSLIIDIYRKTRILIDLILNLDLDTEELTGILKNKTKLKFSFSYSFNLPYANGRTVRGFSFNNNDKDVHTIVCRDLKQGKSTNSVVENLYRTYKIHREFSIGDFIDELNEPKFKELPLWAIVNPWSSLSIKKSRKVYLNGFYKNRSMHDLTFENFLETHIESKMYSYEAAKSQVMQHEK